MKLKSYIPDLLTCLNLFCGCVALIFVFKNDLVLASGFVLIGMLFDFADGMAARTLNAFSLIGKQLDSLADMVTFGVVPGSIVYQLMDQSLNNSPMPGSNLYFIALLHFFPFLITICSALRLAKFNVDVRQLTSFIGLPTPAAALLICSLPMILKSDNFHLSHYIMSPPFLIGLTALVSYLLISPFPLFALKFKSLSWADNKIKYIFLVCSFALFSIFTFVAIPIILLLYILLSFAEDISLKKSQR